MAQNVSKGPLQIHPTNDIPSLVAQINDVLRRVRDELDQVQSLRGAEIDAYTVTNGTTSRSFDADSVSTAALADVVATLIEDLKAAYGFE